MRVPRRRAGRVGSAPGAACPTGRLVVASVVGAGVVTDDRLGHPGHRRGRRRGGSSPWRCGERRRHRSGRWSADHDGHDRAGPVPRGADGPGLGRARRGRELDPPGGADPRRPGLHRRPRRRRRASQRLHDADDHAHVPGDDHRDPDAASCPVDEAHSPRVEAPKTMSGGDARLDRAGVIHLVYYRTDQQATIYQTFSTVTDTWGPPAVVSRVRRAGRQPGLRRAASALNAIALARDGTPFVVFAGATGVQGVPARPGASWVEDGDDSDVSSLHPAMTFDRQNRLHLAWLEGEHEIRYAMRDAAGQWSASEIVASGDPAVLSNGGGDQSPAITVDATDQPTVLYLSGHVGDPDERVRMKIKTAAGWVADDPDVFAHAPGSYADGDGALGAARSRREHPPRVPRAGRRREAAGARSSCSRRRRRLPVRRLDVGALRPAVRGRLHRHRRRLLRRGLRHPRRRSGPTSTTARSSSPARRAATARAGRSHRP